MKNFFFLSTLILFFASTVSIGQIDQGTYQRGMTNFYTDVLLYPDSSFIMAESFQESDRLRAALIARSPYEEVLWEIVVDEDIEVIVFQKLIPIDDSSFGVLGYRRNCCDCLEAESFYQLRSQLDGSLIDEVNQILPEGFVNNAFVDEEFDVALTDWGFTVPNFNGAIKTVFNFDLQGNLLGSYTLSPGGDRITGFQGDFIMEQQNTVYRFDMMGTALDSIQFIDDLYQIDASNNTLAILDNEFLRLYNSDFEPINSIAIEQGDAAVFGSANGFHFYNNSMFYRIDEMGEIELSYEFIIVPGLQIHGFSALDDIYMMAGRKIIVFPNFNFQVYHSHAAWQLHGVGGPAPLWHTDLGLTEITLNALEIEETQGGVNYEATVSVTVANEGTFAVSDFFLNHARSDGFCFDFYENEFYQESVPYQDEITVLMENITGFAPPAVGDSVQLNICVFVTNPMNQMDIDNTNDVICIDDYFFLSTEEVDLGEYVKVYPNPAKNVLRIDSELTYSEIRLFNSLGRIVETKVLNNQGNLDISHLTPGFYLLQLETERGQVTKKVIIE